MRTIQMIVHTV